METEQKSENRYRALTMKIVSAAGFVLVLIFGAWGVIQVGRVLPQLGSTLSSAAVSLSSIFIPAEHLSITIPSANITSGEPFTLSWTHENKRGAGTYTVSFACRDGVSVQTVMDSGVYQTVFCNTPFNLTNAQDSMKLVVTSTSARFVDVPFTVAFTRLSDGKVTASTQLALTVTNASYSEATSTPTGTTGSTAPAAPTTPAPAQSTTPRPTTTVKKPTTTTRPPQTYTYTTAGRPSNPNGASDLAVTILDIGSINPSTGSFTSGTTVRRSDTVSVRFMVENTGDKTVDTWTFNAVLPTMPMNIYSADLQPSLGPGDKIQYTIQFDRPDAFATGGAFTINVDPSNMLWNEHNKNNNVAKVYLTVLNY